MIFYYKIVEISNKKIHFFDKKKYLKYIYKKRKLFILFLDNKPVLRLDYIIWFSYLENKVI